jgi:transposase-like protein
MSEHDLHGEGPSGPRADRPKRRHFSAAYKLKILAEYEAVSKPGEKGAILRREGLYDSSVQRWREQRDKGALRGLSGEQSVPAAEVSKERAKEKAAIAKLERENARLAKKLAQSEAALEILGKGIALLEMMSESADSENS